MLVQRRWTLAWPIVSIICVLAACAGLGRSPAPIADADCKDEIDTSQPMIPLKQSVKYLHDKFPKCIAKIASKQQTGTGSGNGTPITVGCAGGQTTTIVVSAYSGAGVIDATKYGDGNGKQRGFVVAKITNTGTCQMADPFPLPSGESVYWVIDRKSPNEGSAWRSHFIVATTGDYLAGKENWAIDTCGHSGSASDYARYKPGKACDDGPQLDVSNNVSAGAEKAKKGRGGDDGPAYWISCGGDCCYSNDFGSK